MSHLYGPRLVVDWDEKYDEGQPGDAGEANSAFRLRGVSDQPSDFFGKCAGRGGCGLLTYMATHHQINSLLLLFSQRRCVRLLSFMTMRQHD